MDTPNNYENPQSAENPADVPPQVAPQPISQPQIVTPPVSYTAQPGYSALSPTEAPRPKKSSGRVWKTLIASALILALVVSSSAITYVALDEHWSSQFQNLSRQYSDKLNAHIEDVKDKSYINSGNSISGSPNQGIDGGLTPAQVYAQTADSVVAIICTAGSGYFQNTSSGSGFIMSEDGYIATNYHVVEGAQTITISCSDGTEFKAKFVGGDSANDIAIIKADVKGLNPVTVGRSDHLIVGDQVVAIGNPLGNLASTLTVGYVSAKDRMVNTDGNAINMIQTDAAINSGNSGGPLFNMKGEVVGITSAKYTGETASGATIEGIGFAIPMDDVIGMLNDLMTKGYISGAYLGVYVKDVDQATSQTYGIPLGVLITEVMKGSCAEKAGVKAQDVIVNLGGYDVKNTSELSRALRKFQPGDTVSITVYRMSEGGEIPLTVTLDEKPKTN